MILTIGLLLNNVWSSAQEPQDSITTGQPKDTIAVQHFSEPVTVISDTTVLVGAYPLDTLDTYRKHSPAKATIMSAVLPGLGQIYNKKYWKVPIVYAAIGASTYYFIKYQNNYQKYRRAYIDINDGDPNTDYRTTGITFPAGYSEEQIKQSISNGKDGYRRWRDWAILAVIISYGMNVIDANVDAHLFDYNIDDNISLNIRPCFLQESMYSQKIGLNLCLTF